MIKIGIIANENLPSFERRTKFLLDIESSMFSIEKYDLNKTYDFCLTEKEVVPHKKNYRVLIYSRPDNMLYPPYEWMTFFGKIAYRLVKFKKKREYLKFLNSVDSIITSSVLQATDFFEYSRNVHTVADSIPSSLLVKEHFGWIDSNFLELCIECSGANVNSILQNKNFIKGVKESNFVRLNVCIDPDIGNSLIWKNNFTMKSLVHVFGEQVRCLDFSRENMLKVLSEADIGVIPVDEKCYFAYSKPDNRPSIFLANAIPCVMTPIPSYFQSFERVEGAFFASSSDSWKKIFEDLYVAKKQKNNIQVDRDYIISKFSQKTISNEYLRIFNDLARKIR